jgi:histone-arginine methyltransferase CARM1
MIDGLPHTSSSNNLDLKNPYFRYTGQPPMPPPGVNTISPSENYWANLDLQSTILDIFLLLFLVSLY